MPANPLFSTYRAGENRVTASMLAVFERTDLALVERLLAGAYGEASLPFVTFANQVAGGGSVPDAAMSASFNYLFEVKTQPNAVEADQLQEHLKILDRSFGHERLFVITPDAEEPPVVQKLGDDRVTWFSFRDLSEAIDAVTADPGDPIGEQTRFLLRELKQLFVEDGLLGHEDTVIVAARNAYPEYLRTGAYVCQAGRSFKVGVNRMGFYTNKAIQPEIPMIRHRRDNLELSVEHATALKASGDKTDGEVGRLIEELLENSPRQSGEAFQVFLLTSPEDEETLHLGKPIRNTTTDHRGQPWAWTLGQRYLRSDLLGERPETTTQLDARHGRA